MHILARSGAARHVPYRGGSHGPPREVVQASGRRQLGSASNDGGRVNASADGGGLYSGASCNWAGQRLARCRCSSTPGTEVSFADQRALRSHAGRRHPRRASGVPVRPRCREGSRGAEVRDGAAMLKTRSGGGGAADGGPHMWRAFVSAADADHLEW